MKPNESSPSIIHHPLMQPHRNRTETPTHPRPKKCPPYFLPLHCPCLKLSSGHFHLVPLNSAQFHFLKVTFCNLRNSRRAEFHEAQTIRDSRRAEFHEAQTSGTPGGPSSTRPAIRTALLSLFASVEIRVYPCSSVVRNPCLSVKFVSALPPPTLRPICPSFAYSAYFAVKLFSDSPLRPVGLISHFGLRVSPPPSPCPLSLHPAPIPYTLAARRLHRVPFQAKNA